MHATEARPSFHQIRSFAPALIEPLEARIAPATVLTFVDGVDGDIVKIISDKNLSGSVTFAMNGSPSEITLTGAGMDGANITTVVTRSPGGDGFVNIGRITTSLDLGNVVIKGDLGEIDAGNGTSPLPAVKSLKVMSMGLFGDATKPASGNGVSQISGDLGKLDVAGNVIGARINVTGKAGTVKIGGDLRGTATNFSGRLDALAFTSVFIGGDLVAGAGDESGKIVTTGKLGKLTIRDSVFGALDNTADTGRGQIFAGGGAGPIFIGGDVTGAVSEEKAIEVIGNATSITINGSLIGGAGLNSGAIFVTGNAGPIKIGRDAFGGGGELSGSLKITGNTGALTIGGTMRGGTTLNAGSIFVTGNTGPIKIGLDVQGSTGDFSGSIKVNGTVGGLTIGGSLKGGSGSYQTVFRLEQISFFGGSIGPVRINGDVIGNTGTGGGVISLGPGAPSFFLGGSIIGGGNEVPNVFAFPGGGVALGDVGTVTVGGDILGSPFGGGLLTGGNVGKLTIKGSLVSPTEFGTATGSSTQLILSSIGTGVIGGGIVGSPDIDGNSRALTVSGNVGSLTIVGAIQGGAGPTNGSMVIGGNVGTLKVGALRGGSNIETGAISVGGRVNALTIGSVDGGTGTFTTAQIQADSFGKVLIRGDLAGGANPNSGSLRATAGGIDFLTIGGSLRAAPQGGDVSATASLGVVKIGGDILGGVFPGQSTLAGQKATSITVAGDLTSASAMNAPLIYIAQSAGKVSVGGDIRGSGQNTAKLFFAYQPGFSAPGFTSLTVKGSVTDALIAGGLRNDLIGNNEDATLGPISVLRDFTSSSIAASVNVGGDNDFATADDTKVGTTTPLLSRIASITIKGQVSGTADANDGYGFVAQSIGPVKIGGVSYVAAAVSTPLGKIFDDVQLRLV